MPDIFARKEVKFILSPKQYEDLKKEIGRYLVEEQFHNYRIYNIYYDDDNFSLIRKSIEKPLYKEKLRIRSYTVPENSDDPVFVEIKKKYRGIVYKRRINLPLTGAYRFVEERGRTEAGDMNAGGADPNAGEVNVNAKEPDMNTREIGYLCRRYELKPKVFLSYAREAWLWYNDPDLRITFDTELKYRIEKTGLENGNEQAIPFCDDIVMEVKCKDALPMEFAAALSKLKIHMSSFSKIGTVYTRLKKEKKL